MRSTYCGPLTWSVLRALQRTGLLRRLNFSVRARIGGKRVSVPIREGIGTALLMPDEPWMLPLMTELLRQFPGVFVDVGVNVGQTLMKVKAIEPGRSYVGFEPNPACVHYSQELILLQRYTDARLVPTGLADHDGLLQLDLYTTGLDDSTATIVSDFRPGFPVFRKLIIPVMRFDTAARDLDIGMLGVVKIDVEGGEREVLIGMEGRLRIDRPAIVLEILPAGAQAKRLQRQQDVEALFARADYRLFTIIQEGGLVRLASLDRPIGVHDDLSLSNYLALPKERSAAVLASLQNLRPQM